VTESQPAPPVVLVHGFASSSARTWVETGWIDLLHDAGRQVVPIDLLGHGESAKPHDPTAYDHLEEQAFEALPDGPVDAVGFSLGARTLLVLASAHPERFAHLVLAGVGANLFRTEDSAVQLAATIEDLATGDGGSGPESPVAQYFRTQAAEPGSDPMALAACLRRPGAPPITDAGLARIDCPVLVVIGEHDFAGPGEPLAERLPDARVVTLRGVDHFATPKDFGFLDAGLEFLGASIT
jgi:pimeloyl-ACP methyl ester carboxylesterase